MCDSVIIHLEERKLVQKILDQFDKSTTLSMMNTLNGFTLNVLLIFDIILLLVINDDIIGS